MDYRERIEAKVGTVFQIANQYIMGHIPLETAKEQIGGEMVNIRPVQFEAVKVELGKRLTEEGLGGKAEKLLELFKSYLTPPYSKLKIGHPLRNYYEENIRVRQCLVRIDEMEAEEAALDDWKNIYEILTRFKVHIKRQEKVFYPLMISKGMRLQVEKAKELGRTVINKIDKNQEMLESGDIINFLFNQRSLTFTLMKYLDLEERVLFPKVLMSMKDLEFVELKRVDDMEGYAYIEHSEDFIPKDNINAFVTREDNMNRTGTNKNNMGKDRYDLGLLLPSLLAAKSMSIIYYTISGEVVYTMGDLVAEDDLYISEETKQALLNGSEKQRKYWYNQGNQAFLVTYSLAADSSGRYQGILKTKEDITEIKGLTGEFLERQSTEEEGRTDNSVKKENLVIDSNQNIAELFTIYPKFKVDFYSLDEELKGLQGPLGIEILKEATVGMLAKSLRIDVGYLVERINELLENYQ